MIHGRTTVLIKHKSENQKEKTNSTLSFYIFRELYGGGVHTASRVLVIRKQETHIYEIIWQMKNRGEGAPSPSLFISHQLAKDTQKRREKIMRVGTKRHRGAIVGISLLFSRCSRPRIPRLLGGLVCGALHRIKRLIREGILLVELAGTIDCFDRQGIGRCNHLFGLCWQVIFIR